MKIFLGLMALFVSLSAVALPVYNCDVTAIAKSGWNKPWNKKLLISSKFSNNVTFSETVLDLRVDQNGVLHGSVNGQPGFMLSGDVTSGKFESAYHTGTIKCDPKIDLSFVMYFKPWKQFFTIDPVVSRDHIQNSVRLDQIDYGLLCFIGDVKESNAGLSQAFSVQGKMINPYRIQFIWEANDCVKWIGNNPDDTECVEYKVQTHKKEVTDCYGEPDPRS
ncbi:MAG: hypothetical protein K2P81_09900 [Bacteriovoracaceae bacterium]|nr:hypothetical protein [Bacteriovoracaceae bacterium]